MKRFFSKRLVTAVMLSMIIAGAVSGADKLDGHQNVTPDDVLSYKDGQYHLDGKPFAEISFNYFGLFWEFFRSVRAGRPLDETNPSYVEKEQCLKELHELGFRTIRVFGHPFFQTEFKEMYNDPAKREKYYEAIDRAISLAEKYDIGIVWSLGVELFDDRYYVPRKGWQNDGEDVQELMSNPHSKNRLFLNRYLEDVVTRYKNRRGIVMWELSNEMTLRADIPQNPRAPTFAQLVTFTNDISQKIKDLDPMRMVNSGGSVLRNQNWGLSQHRQWTRLDTVAENRKMYEWLYKDSACDVVDVHFYEIFGDRYFKDDSHREEVRLTLRDYREIADAMGKPFMVGEFGAPANNERTKKIAETVSGRKYFTKIESPDSKFFIQHVLDHVIESDVQLAYYWTYRTEHRQQRGVKDITPERTPVALEQIVEANRRLQKKWGITPREK